MLKNRIPKPIYLFLVLGVAWNTLIAQYANELNLEQIFINNYFGTPAQLSYNWIGDKYVRRENGNRELVSYSPETGLREIIIQSGDFGAEYTDSRIDQYYFSEDGSRLLVGISTKHSSSYWLLDLNLNLSSIGQIDLKQYDEDAISFQISPDNKKVSFIHKANLYVYEIDTQEITQLTTDGSETIINSTASFPIYAPFRSRYAWSPDSKSIAYLQIDTKGVRTEKMINYTDSLYAQIIEFPRVKPGEMLAAVKAGVVNISTSLTTWMKIEEDPRDNYIPHLVWQPNSEVLFIQQVNRRWNKVNIIAADPNSGEIKKIFTEKEEAFLEYFTMRWIEQGKYFIWMSYEDGWYHVYKISADGQKKELLTPGNFDIEQLLHIDESSGWIYYIASPKSSVQRYLYRSKLDGSGTMERMTPETKEGVNEYDISPSGKWAFRTFSKLGTPPITTLVSLPGHKAIRTIEDNQELVSKLKAIKPSPVEFFKVSIEAGVEVDGWQIKPPGFDPDKKYPVIFYVYSMPAGQFTLDRWRNNFLFYQLLAREGFIVMCMDGRGTPALKGRDWRTSIHKKHGILPADDIAKATKIVIDQHDYLDANRLGVYGWSGGGLMSLLLILRHPDLFHAAIPGAYISHHKYYHSGFTERFLGLPQENHEAYEETAVLNYVDNLKGELLLVHGTGDNNVLYQGTEALINKLIEAKKRFTVLPYPNRNHGMSRMRAQNTAYHLHDMYLWFF